MRSKEREALVDLVDRFHLGVMELAEFEELQGWLERSPESREEFVRMADWDTALCHVARGRCRESSEAKEVAASSAVLVELSDKWEPGKMRYLVFQN